MTTMPLDFPLQKHSLKHYRSKEKILTGIIFTNKEIFITLMSCINLINLVYVNFIFAIPTKCTHTVEYIYYYLLHVSYMFRLILHYPQGKFLPLAPYYPLIVMLLHW